MTKNSVSLQLIKLIEEASPTVGQLTLECGQVAYLSDRCPQNGDEKNEDTAIVIEIDRNRCVLAVADGFGGQPLGEVAAATAIQMLQRSLEQDVSERELREAILTGIESGNRAVRALGLGAATTLAVVEINGANMRSYHVGDSEIMLIGRRGRLKSRTLSHGPVAYAVEAGLLHPTEALYHSERHVVSNMLGSAAMRIEIGAPFEIAAQDTILVGSDGLFDNLQLKEIVRAVCKSNLPEAVATLAEQARQRMLKPRPGQPSKPDDLTILAFRRILQVSM